MKAQKIMIVLAVVVVLSCGIHMIAAGQEEILTEAWAICQPGDIVNCRAAASTKSEAIGYLMTGDQVMIDGRTRNGFAHCQELTFETDEGWVYAGYLVFEEPEWLNGAWYRIQSNGRVAARKYVDGPRRCWLSKGTEVQVFWWAGDWAVTNRGYVKTEYLEEMKDGAGEY